MITSFLLAGCATFSQDAGFGEVQNTTQQYIRQKPVWANTVAQKAQNDSQVNKLLAEPLSADDAVQIALLNNAALQADFYDLQIAEANMVQAGRLPNPGFSMLYARQNGDYTIEQILSLNIMALLVTPKAMEVEKSRFAATKHAVAQRVLALANEARRAYYDALAAKQRLHYLVQVKEVSAATAELARRMQASGNWSALDAARERAFYADTSVELRKAQHQQVATEEGLVRLLGLSDAAKLQLPERLADLPANQDDLRHVTTEDFSKRLDLQQLRANTDALAKSLGLTRTTRYINVLEFGPARVLDGRRSEPANKGFEIRFELPVFDWGTAKVKRAEAEYMQAMHQAAASAVIAASEVRTSYDFYRRSYDVAQQYRDEVLPLRGKIQHEHLLRFNGMLVSPFELISDARTQVLSVVSYIDALRDFWIAETQLEQSLIGKPMNQERN
ncbi:MAG TPA: TolC family protein [Methylophilus sp.]|nr:TolC family protein [Methylophilus sp.]HQQ33874.1 TolC family protein [Methylophilus sp.]